MRRAMPSALRDQISARIAVKCSAKNKNVKPKASVNSGHRYSGGKAGLARRFKLEILAGWCSVFHHSTEYLMIGKLMEPTRVTMAAARAARPLSSIAR